MLPASIMQNQKKKTKVTKTNRFNAVKGKIKAAVVKATPKAKVKPAAAAEAPVKQRRGFAVMSEENKKRIAKLGGLKVRRKYGKTYFAKIGKIGGANSRGGRKPAVIT